LQLHFAAPAIILPISVGFRFFPNTLNQQELFPYSLSYSGCVMRRLRIFMWIGWALLFGFGLLMILPQSRFAILAVVRQEDFYEGHPMGYWATKTKDQDPKQREEAIRALNSMGENAKDALPELIDAMSDSEDLVRILAALAISKIGPDAAPAVGVLAKGLKDNHPQVRINSALALTRIGPGASSAVPDLLEAMNRPENATIVRPFYHSVRQQVTAAFGHIGPGASAAIPALTAALTDPDYGVRAKAAQSLGNIGTSTAPICDELKKCVKDENPMVRAEATAALKKLLPNDPEVKALP
jgi:HEAT repeat protein